MNKSRGGRIKIISNGFFPAVVLFIAMMLLRYSLEVSILVFFIALIFGVGITVLLQKVNEKKRFNS